jgi:hypothetical protein
LHRFHPISLLVLIALAACSSAPASTALSPAPSSAGTTARPSTYRVLFTASTTSGTEILLYDSASSTPQQLVSLPAGVPAEAHFVSAQKVAYVETSATSSGISSRIMTIDLSTRASTADVNVSGYVPAFAYSHDGSMLAYLLHDSANKPSLHVRRNGKETSLNLNAIPGRGIGRDDEVRLEYSADDKYLLMVDTFVGNQGQAPQTGQFLVLRTADTTVAFLPPSSTSANATMATWARHSNRFFYRDAVGVRTWDSEVRSVSTLAGGLHWYDPAASPDDRQLAYTDIDTQFVPRVKIYDLHANQHATTSPAPRSHPIFITADTIWYLEEVACTGECMGGPSQPSGKVFAYSLTSKSETSLPFSDVHSLSQLSVFPG